MAKGPRLWRAGFRFGVGSALAAVAVAAPVAALTLGSFAQRFDVETLNLLTFILWFCTGGLLIVAALAETTTWLITGRRQTFLELAAVLLVLSWYVRVFERL